MTELEKATFYIVGFVDGCLAAINLRDPFDDGTTEEDEIEAVETERLLPAMRKRIRELVHPRCDFCFGQQNAQVRLSHAHRRRSAARGRHSGRARLRN